MGWGGRGGGVGASTNERAGVWFGGCGLVVKVDCVDGGGGW